MTTPTRREGSWAALACSILIQAVAGGAVAGPEPGARSLAAAVIPGDDELAAAYRRDPANQRLQAWGEYRRWVRTFYEGNMLSDGWGKFAEATLGPVQDGPSRRAVAAEVAELGRIIGLEWAKDSSVRKIDTSDLRRWNDRIAAARRAESGDGRRTLEALSEVRRAAAARSRGS